MLSKQEFGRQILHLGIGFAVAITFYLDILSPLAVLLGIIVGGLSSILSKRVRLPGLSWFLDHFEREEQYMLEYGYPEYSIQKKQHQEFKRKTVDFCMETMAHKVTVPTEIFSYLKLWWTNHILQEDMKYKKFFNEKGLK